MIVRAVGNSSEGNSGDHIKDTFVSDVSVLFIFLVGKPHLVSRTSSLCDSSSDLNSDLDSDSF